MSTCRAAITDAMLALQVLAPGDDPGADELDVGLRAIGDLLGELHEARGPLRAIDVSADHLAAEDQRVRIEPGFTVTVGLPNSTPIRGGLDPDDCGFRGARTLCGSAGPADGVAFRAPRDGARVEIVGTRQALYFYRADLNQWLPALDLGLDDELPLNHALSGAFTALLAERLSSPMVGDGASTALIRRAAAGAARLMLRAGIDHAPTRAVYF